MKSVLLLVVAACAAAVEEAGPFDFLFSKCDAPAASGDVGECARDLLRAALERARPGFSSGVQVGGRLVVLDPLQVPDVQDRDNARPKWAISKTRVTGLRDVALESVLLNERTAAAVVSVPELRAETQLTVRYGFLPLRPRLEVILEQLQLLVGANWSVEAGQLQLSDVRAQIWLDGYNVTVKHLSSMGTSMAKALNDNSAEIIEFITPSLEAALVRKIESSDQKERNDALEWLRKIVS